MFDVIFAYGFAAHWYADDTQVYISTPASNHSDAMKRLSDCITLIRDWMADNRLKLNEDETSQVKSSQVAFNAVCQAHTVTMQCSFKSYKNT